MPLAVFLSIRMGPHKCISSISQEKWWPIHCHWQYFYPSEWAHTIESVEDTVDPFMTIGSNSQHQEWAHISVSAAFLRRSGEYIHCHWQYFYPQEQAHTRELVVSHKTQWAHTSVSAVFFSTKNGPTQSYQQHFSGEVVGPFVAIGSIFIHQNGPTQVYRQHFSGKVVGPFIAIGSNFIHKNGPIQGSR